MMKMEQENEVGQIPIRRIVVLIAVPFMLLAYFLMPMFSWPKISMWEVLANVIGSRYVPTSVTISLIILLIIPFLELCLFIPKETQKTVRLILVFIQFGALILLYDKVRDVSVFGFSLVELGFGFFFYVLSAVALLFTDLLSPEYAQQSDDAQEDEPLQHEGSPQGKAPVNVDEMKEVNQTPSPIPAEEAQGVMETLQPATAKETTQMMSEDVKKKVTISRWPLSNKLCAGLAALAIVLMYVSLFLLPLTSVLNDNASLLLTRGLYLENNVLIGCFLLLVSIPLIEFLIFCLGWGNRVLRMVCVLLQAVVLVYLIPNLFDLLYFDAGIGLYCYAICTAFLFLIAIFFRDCVISELPHTHELLSDGVAEFQEEKKMGSTLSQDGHGDSQSCFMSNEATNQNSMDNYIHSNNILSINIMKSLGNIVWLLFGGIFIAIEYVIAGLLLCCTIIGIPFGIQVFKFASLALWPFGREVRNKQQATGCVSTLMNIIWIFIGGLFLAIQHAILGIIFFLTIIGIPFAKQHFKLAAIAIMPFGREIVSSDKPYANSTEGQQSVAAEQTAENMVNGMSK